VKTSDLLCSFIAPFFHFNQHIRQVRLTTSHEAPAPNRNRPGLMIPLTSFIHTTIVPKSDNLHRAGTSAVGVTA
jgi:hypothetical protein